LKIEYLEEYVRQLRAVLFGRKSEKRHKESDKDQINLFDEAEVALSEEQEAPRIIRGYIISTIRPSREAYLSPFWRGTGVYIQMDGFSS
jgi:hypothetical protein